MSERELREDCWYDQQGESRCVHCGLYWDVWREGEDHEPDCPIAADPDVVEAAKYLEELAVEQRNISDGLADSDSAVATAALNQSIAYHAAGIKLQVRFCFRLTADGYEWTDE